MSQWYVVQWLIGIIFAMIVLGPLGLTIWLLCHAARAATRAVGRCRSCGYDLRRLGPRRQCPECGRPFRINEDGDAIS